MPISPAPGDGTPMLREARPRDLDGLWRLDQLCFEPGIAYSRRELSRLLALPGAVGVVAEVGPLLCGFALACPEPPHSAHVVTLDVHPTFRRRGLGRRLIERVLERSGAKRTVLEVDVRNSGAVAFYRNLGFRESGRLVSYYGPGLDALRMVRSPEPTDGRRTTGR